MGFLDEIIARTLPADGDNAALLRHHANAAELACLDALCLSAPERIVAVHERFITAGARLIRTQSPRANEHDLAPHGLADRINELNWTAARLARDAATAGKAATGKRIYVAGAVRQPGIDLSSDRRALRAALQEQIGALLDGGVDGIVFEAFRDVETLALALEIKYALHHCPAIATLDHLPDAAAITRLIDSGADVIGTFGLLPSAALADAGTPIACFAGADADFSTLGTLTPQASLIGGADGVTPDKITARAAALSPAQPAPAQ
jgi:homocysteine S-methyltransferase